MTALAGAAYAKMNGLGNEILVVDLRMAKEWAFDPATVRALAAAPGLAFDQLMALHQPSQSGVEAFVRIYNADGSEVSACGNGSRCVAWWLLRGTDRNDAVFATRAGAIACRREAEWTFSIDMGRPDFEWRKIPVGAPIEDTSAASIGLDVRDAALGRPSLVSMGNPHAVFWVEDFAGFDLAEIGPRLERHPLFPERANISLALVQSRGHIRLKVWERGAGLTKACGTAACAAAVAAARLGRVDRACRVSLPGGDLFIEWRADDHVLMTGPCALESEGRFGAAVLMAGAADQRHVQA